MKCDNIILMFRVRAADAKLLMAVGRWWGSNGRAEQREALFGVFDGSE